jgi:hypothetical protein
MHKICIRTIALDSIKQQVRCVSFVFIVAALVFAGEDQSSRRADRWVGTWSASPQTGFSATDFNNQTLRMVVHTSVGGDRLRVRLSNAFGSQPLVITATHVGTRSAGAALVVGSDRAVTFSGRSAVTIPSGALVVSDAVNLAVPALSDLAVSIFCLPMRVPQRPTTCSLSLMLRREMPRRAKAGTVCRSSTLWLFLTGVEVSASEHIDEAIVAFGDSITDGAGSGPTATLAGRTYSQAIDFSSL